MRPFPAVRFREVGQLIGRAEEGRRFGAGGANVRFRPKADIARPHNDQAITYAFFGDRSVAPSLLACPCR